MMESFIEGGHQDPGPLNTLVYGKSVTDRCIAWPRTEELLRKLASAVRMRRARAAQDSQDSGEAQTHE